MKPIASILALAALSMSVVACKAPPTTIACTVTEATATLTCNIDGFIASDVIPAGIANDIGILAPLTGGAVTAQSGSRAGAPSSFTALLNTSTHIVTLTNKATGKAVAFKVAQPTPAPSATP